jgi:hypothetical protein
MPTKSAKWVPKQGRKQGKKGVKISLDTNGNNSDRYLWLFFVGQVLFLLLFFTFKQAKKKSRLFLTCSPLWCYTFYM